MMQDQLLVTMGLLGFVVVLVLLPMMIENNIFAGIMTLLLSPFLRKRKADQDRKD